MDLLYEGIKELDKQIFDAKHSVNYADGADEEKRSEQKDKPQFKSRKLLHGPGSKEGWENALHNENRVIQICEEGDLW